MARCTRTPPSRRQHEISAQSSFPRHLLSLLLFACLAVGMNAASIHNTIHRGSTPSNPSVSSMRLRKQARHQAMARFATQGETLVKAQDDDKQHDKINKINDIKNIVPKMNNNTTLTNSTNSTSIDMGDPKPPPTDGESIFESLPEQEANLLTDNFFNGSNPLKWTYPTTTLLDGAGDTNSSKMSYGFLTPNTKVQPIEDSSGLWFKGDAQDSIPVRSRSSYSQGANIRVSLDKSTTGAGPTHFVVLSTNPEFKYKRWSGEPVDGFKEIVEVEEDLEQEQEQEEVVDVLHNGTNQTSSNATLSNGQSNTTSVSLSNVTSSNNSTNITEFINSTTNSTNATTNSTNPTNPTNSTAAAKSNKIKKKAEVNPKEGKYVVVTWKRDRLIIHTETERRSIECSVPSNYTLQILVNRWNGRIEVTGCSNDDAPLSLQDPDGVGTFTSADAFYVYVGADLETPTKLVTTIDPQTNNTIESVEVDVEKLLNSTGRAIFKDVTISEKIDRYFQCAHRPDTSELQHDFYEDFEAGRLTTRWVIQRPISEDASTQTTPAYGFGGATPGESGVAKKIFWLDGDRGYSLRVRRPFRDAIQLKTTVRKEARCSNHWMAISRSKRFTDGVEKRETVFHDALLRPDVAAWIYPREKGTKKYGRAENKNKNDLTRLHYGFGDGPDRPWHEDEGTAMTESNPTDLLTMAHKAQQFGERSGLWFAGSAGSATLVRTSDMIDRGTDPNGGIVFKMKIDRTEKCSNHFVVLSADPKYDFAWGAKAASQSGAVVIGFNCNEKVMYTPTGQALKTQCSALGTTEIRIKVTTKGIVFEDDLNCETLHLKGESTPSRNVYVYLGASQDMQDHTATALRIARMKHLSNRTNNVTLDEEDKNDMKDSEGPGRYLRSYFRDFSVVRIVVTGPFDPETIVVGWGCNTKVGVLIGSQPSLKKTAYCPMKGKHRVSLDMISKPGVVIFRTETEQELKNTPEECDTGLGSLPGSAESGDDEQVPQQPARMCPDIELPSNFTKRGVFYVFMGSGAYPTSDQPTTRKTVYESMSIDVPTRASKIEDVENPMPVKNTELYFTDNFGSDSETTSWKEEQIPGHNSIDMDVVTGERMLVFNDTTLVPVRTRRPFAPPFEMVADILKDHKCNNHFFLVSTRKVADFNFDTPTTGDVSAIVFCFVLFFFFFFFFFFSFSLPRSYC